MKFDKLGNHITQIRGISYKPNEVTEEERPEYIPLIKSNNITEDGFLDKGIIYIHQNKVKDEQFIKKGDLVLTASSGSKKTIGKNIQFSYDFGGTFGAFCKLVRPKHTINEKYLFHIFKTRKFRDSIENAVQGANISNLKNEYIDDLQIPLPPLPEQIAIANILSKAEALIAKRKESLALLDEYLKSTFLEMFGDPVRNEKGWEVKRLDEITSIGTGGTPSRSKESIYYNGSIKWVKTTEVNGNYINDTSEKITEIALKESNCKIYPPTTILMAMYGQGKTRGNVGYLNTHAATNQACAAILPSKGLNQIYLFELFKNSYQNIRNLGRGGNQENMNLKIVGGLIIPVPPLDLQKQFAAVVQKVEALKEKYQKSLGELENLYGSLSQRAFRGELG